MRSEHHSPIHNLRTELSSPEASRHIFTGKIPRICGISMASGCDRLILKDDSVHPARRGHVHIIHKFAAGEMRV